MAPTIVQNLIISFTIFIIKIISKNLRITPEILKNNYDLSYKRGEFIFKNLKNILKKKK